MDINVKKDVNIDSHVQKPNWMAVTKSWLQNTWQFIRRNWKISGSIALIIVLAAVGGIVWKAKQKKVINSKPVVSAQNQLKQQFLDQLPELQKQALADPTNPSIQQQLGVAKYATGDLQGAQQAYEKGTQLDTKNAVLHNNLANTYRDLGDYAKAETEYRLAMQLNSKLTTPYMNLGSIFQYILGKPDTALQVYAEGIKNNPDYIDFYNATAAIYEQQGLKTKAIASFDQALKIQPGNPAAVAGLKRLQ